jgi:small GTP-binding protein
MSESAKTIIKYFCDRFLNLDYYPTSLKAILDLEIAKLRNINKEDVKKFKKIDISKLRDFDKIMDSGIQKLVSKTQIKEEKLKNALIASKLISNAWKKRNLYLKNPKMKVVVAGLDFAGKTSLINRLINDYNYNDIVNLEPTIGANIEEYQSDKLNLILWDLGGQKDHIDEYLASPENFFIQLEILIFVIDSQDNSRYLEAVDYLRDIINTLEFLKENPYIVVLLNKVDSDLREDPDFQIKLEYLTEKVSKIFDNTENKWNFDIIKTSIYNYYLNEPRIIESIKNIFSTSDNENKNDFTLLDIEAKFQKILDLNLQLMDKFASELSEVKQILLKLNLADVSRTFFSVPFEKINRDYISPDLKNSERKKKKKKKDKIKKPKKNENNKRDKGPPKPLYSRPPLNINKNNSDNYRKLTSEKLETVKASLKQKDELSINILTPPIAPLITSKQDMDDLSSLKPPPPPPNISASSNNNSNTIRRQVLSELKEIFIKRGLVDN